MYLQDGKLLRQVNNVYKEDYDYLLSSGLYETLIEKKYLIPYTEVSNSPLKPEIAYRVIAPEKIPFISFPYEWSFS